MFASMRARIWLGIAGAFLAGIGTGGTLRPIVGSIVRDLTLSTSPDPLPLDLDLWNAMTAQFRVLDKTGSGPKIVYLGDSITDRMRVDEALTFSGGVVFNRSVSGDTTFGTLKRIKDSFPDDVEVCFVLVGVNDLSRWAWAASVSDRIEGIARALIERGVKHVVVESILPTVKVETERVVKANEGLRKIPQRVQSSTFLDLFTSFSRNGRIDASLFSDGVHLNERGMLTRLRLEVAHLTEAVPALNSRISSRALEHRAP
jgi:lysophospholipase L1-like esterase